MRGKMKNCLVVIENGQLTTYELDDKLVWEIGRPSKDNVPDIKLYSETVSRKHGRFQNIDGMWFYLDKKGKNGTVYNGKHITVGIGGRVKPVTLKDRDILIFGGGKEAAINSRTVWTLFLEKCFDEKWRIEDTKGLELLTFTDGEQTTQLSCPDKGTVIGEVNGMAIYMGDITYLTGDISVTGK